MDFVVTTKLAVVPPALIFTVAGTVAFALLLARLTVIPAVGAGLEIVTTALVFLEPTTVEEARLRAVSLGATTTRLPVAVVPEPICAVTLAVTSAATATVFAVNVPDEDPAMIAIAAGTVTAALLLESLTVVLTATGADRVTLPVDDVGPATDEGVNDTSTGDWASAPTAKTNVAIVRAMEYRNFVNLLVMTHQRQNNTFQRSSVSAGTLTVQHFRWCGRPRTTVRETGSWTYRLVGGITCLRG